MASPTTVFTLEDVASHNTKNDLYMIVHSKVYNLSNYAHKHPGGENLIFDLAGQDATEAFEDVGHSGDARKELEDHLIGELDVPTQTEPEIHSSSKSRDSALSTLARILHIFKERGVFLGLAVFVLFLCYLIPILITP